MLRQDARHDVGAATRRGRHDDAYGTRRIDIWVVWFVPWLILGSLFGLVFLRIALIGLGIGLPDLSANAEKQEGDVSQHAQSLQLEYTRHRRANSTREHRRGQHGKPCTPDR